MKMLIISGLLAFTTFPLLADISFSYNAGNKALTVKGQLCKYGRSSKTKLPTIAIKQVHQYLQQQELAFIEQIRSVPQGMAGHRLDIAKLNIFYNLTPTKLTMDHYFEGNDSCANYQADLLLDFEQNFEQVIPLNTPAKLSFIAPVQDKQAQLNTLQTHYPDVQTLDTPHLRLISSGDEQWGLFEFDHLEYLTSLQSQQSSFYIQAPSIFKQALSEYLMSYGFSISTSADDAYWQFKMTPINKHNFTVFYQHSGGNWQSMKSQPEFLANMTAESEQEQLELIKLQLEVLELVEQFK